MGFCRKKNVRALLARTAYCLPSLQTIMEKTFTDRHKTAKFAKVCSLEYFLLYGIHFKLDILYSSLSLPGQQSVSESDWSDEIHHSIEIGLLGIVRKIITLMPDNMVRRVVGYVVQHEALIALAHNNSIVFRTAVVRVSEKMKVREREGDSEREKRAGEGTWGGGSDRERVCVCVCVCE